MKILKCCVVTTILMSSLTFGQQGQSGRFEYEVYSAGGNSSFVNTDTLGMNEEDKATIRNIAINGVSSDNEQSGLLEYEVYSAGGNSSFVATDTLGMNEEDKATIRNTAINGVPSSNEQSGLFEYETTGLGGNSSFISIDSSGFNKIDKKKSIETSQVFHPLEEVDSLENKISLK